MQSAGWGSLRRSIAMPIEPINVVIIRYDTPTQAADCHRLTPAIGQELQKLLHCQPGVGDDPSQGATADLRVIRHDDPCIGILASEDYMAAPLATKCEARIFECAPDLSPERSVGSVATYAASISTNSLPASVGTGSPASRQSSI
jgi:hypothetical protein